MGEYGALWVIQDIFPYKKSNTFDATLNIEVPVRVIILSTSLPPYPLYIYIYIHHSLPTCLRTAFVLILAVVPVPCGLTPAFFRGGACVHD